MSITKEQIKNLTGIKVDLNNFSYVILDCYVEEVKPLGVDHPTTKLITFHVVKASVYKKYNELKSNEDSIIPIPKDKIEKRQIMINSLEPNNKISFAGNMENLAKSFTKIINILKEQ